MKKIFQLLALFAILAGCNNKETDNAKTTSDSMPADNSRSGSGRTDLPYVASYSSSWSDNVSDEDVKTVLMTYKHWAEGNMSGLIQAIGDSISVDFSDGTHLFTTRDSINGIWTKFRDSLSSVVIDMQAWHKMHATDKKDSYVVTWYKETDTYKSGKVDSAFFHDINQVKDGKIVWYSQYRRTAK